MPLALRLVRLHETILQFLSCMKKEAQRNEFYNEPTEQSSRRIHELELPQEPFYRAKRSVGLIEIANRLAPMEAYRLRFPIPGIRNQRILTAPQRVFLPEQNRM